MFTFVFFSCGIPFSYPLLTSVFHLAICALLEFIWELIVPFNSLSGMSPVGHDDGTLVFGGETCLDF